jgi:hypothetical protein
MKKIPFKKLALTTETIRHLTGAEMRDVGGGLNNPIITTTHSITSACKTFTIATTPINPSGEGD